MIAETFSRLNYEYQYKSSPQAGRKPHAYFRVWLKKIIPSFFITLGCINLFAQNSNDTLHYPEEKHFTNIQQLTFGGDNAEAYCATGCLSELFHNRVRNFFINK